MQFRQGDVFLEQCPPPPASELTPIAADDGDRLVLAFGVASGNAHAVSAKDATLYQVRGWTDRLLLVARTTALVHREHRPITLEPGTYRIRRQREYTPARIRTVAD